MVECFPRWAIWSRTARRSFDDYEPVFQDPYHIAEKVRCGGDDRFQSWVSHADVASGNAHEKRLLGDTEPGAGVIGAPCTARARWIEELEGVLVEPSHVSRVGHSIHA